jgi:uncharacterized protein YukE
MNDSVMQYSSSHIDELTGQLTSGHARLGTHQDDANSAHGNLLANWQGGATDPFTAAHNKLMKSVDELRETLHRGIQGVNTAHDNAVSADGKVGQSFG